MSNRSSGLRVPQPRRVPTGAACAPELHRESAENLAATSNQLPESLMFDFELGDETADFPPACKVHPDPERLQKALDEIRPYSRPRDTLEAKLLRDVQRLKRQVLQEEGRHDTVLLAAKLCGIGYRVTMKGMLSKWFPANAKDTECEASPPTASSATDPSWMEKGCTKKSSNHVHPDNWIPFQYDRYY
eukprot:jgi/Tetstr1/453138/TSEL_040160.t1